MCTRRRRALASLAAASLAALLFVPLSLSAQGRPAGWQVRYDGGEHAAHGADTLAFEDMKPGFHVTTGPAVILWHPDSTVRGDFTVQSLQHLFDTKGRDREGFGLFVGGRDLVGPSQAYTYFLIRNDGRFLIKRRTGEETPTLVPWTEHAAIVRWTAASGSSQANTLAVRVAGETVQFLVNGQVVHSAPRSAVNPEGVFGVRVNHSVNLHVQTITRGP
jgi:hypothetical protein